MSVAYTKGDLRTAIAAMCMDLDEYDLLALAGAVGRWAVEVEDEIPVGRSGFEFSAHVRRLLLIAHKLGVEIDEPVWVKSCALPAVPSSVPELRAGLAVAEQLAGVE